MEFQKDTVTYSKPVFHRTVWADAGGDVIVPDTSPDVDALLWVSAHACLEETTVKEGAVILRGYADFTALYRPEGAAESLFSVTATFPFSHTQDIPGLTPESFVTVSAMPAKVTGSVQNSRKLTLNAKIALSLLCENTASADILTDLSSELGMESKSESTSLSRPAVISNHSISAESTLEVPTGNPEIEKVQDIFVSLTNQSTQAIQNKLVWKSTLLLTVLYTDPDGVVHTMESELPITEILDAPGLNDEMLCRVTATVDQAAYRLPDQRHMEAMVTLTVSATAYEQDSVSYITDAYCPGKALTCEEDTLEVSALPFVREESVTRKESVSLDESEPPIARVLFADAVPCVESVHARAGAAEADLRLALTVLYLSAEETPRLCTAQREIRWTETVEDSAITENMSMEGASSLSHISFCLLGTEEVECRVIFSLSLFGIKTKHVSFLTDASSEDLPLSERPSVVISFAREGDTLWNIAKRYNVPMADLLSANDMTDDITVTDGMQFLIPR